MVEHRDRHESQRHDQAPGADWRTRPKRRDTHPLAPNRLGGRYSIAPPWPCRPGCRSQVDPNGPDHVLPSSDLLDEIALADVADPYWLVADRVYQVVPGGSPRALLADSADHRKIPPLCLLVAE